MRCGTGCPRSGSTITNRSETSGSSPGRKQPPWWNRANGVPAKPDCPSDMEAYNLLQIRQLMAFPHPTSTLASCLQSVRQSLRPLAGKREVSMKSKSKLIAAILGLGLTMAIPGAVIIAQNPDDQSSDQYSKPSAGIQSSMDQDSIAQGSVDQDSTNQGATNLDSTQPAYNDQDSSVQSSSAPVENAGVARVSLIHGDVSTQRCSAGGWSAAALNAPVVAGDRVSTGDKARTELQLDYANMLRLSEHTEANVNTLTHSQIQIQLGRGMENYTVLKNSDADAEIDTPNVAIRTNRRESSFRILVTADDHTEVLLPKAEAETTTPH